MASPIKVEIKNTFIVVEVDEEEIEVNNPGRRAKTEPESPASRWARGEEELASNAMPAAEVPKEKEREFWLDVQKELCEMGTEEFWQDDMPQYVYATPSVLAAATGATAFQQRMATPMLGTGVTVVQPLQMQMVHAGSGCSSIGWLSRENLWEERSESEGRRRFNWRVEARKIQSSNAELVSPLFALQTRCGELKLKMILQAKVMSSAKGGSSFSAAGGQGTVKVKCSSAVLPRATFWFSVGSMREWRGPITADFQQSLTCALPKQEAEWNFTDHVEEDALLVSLEVQEAAPWQ